MARVSTDALASGIATADVLVPGPVVSVEFGITDRTLARWRADPRVNFPKHVIIRSRTYFRRAEIDAWRAAQAGPS